MKVLQLKNKKKGFTLVEIIVVLVIIAVLAAISLPALTGYIAEARLNTAMMAVANMKKAMTAAAASIDVPNFTESMEIRSNSTEYEGNDTRAIFVKTIKRYMSDYQIGEKSQYIISIVAPPKGKKYKDTEDFINNARLFYLPNGVLKTDVAARYKGEYFIYHDGVMEAVNQ